MIRPHHPSAFKADSATMVRDAASGRVLPLMGYGSLKGEFALKRGIDLTKPIAAQTLRKGGKRA